MRAICFFLISLLIKLNCAAVHFKFDKTDTSAQVLAAYKKFHQKKCNPNLKCKKRPFILFRPVAGLGDSLQALEAALFATLKTGNMFFVDWTFYWPELTFDWYETHGLNYKLKNCDVIRKCEPMVEIEGHLTSKSWMHKLVKINELGNSQINSNEWLRYFAKPSEKLNSVINQYKPVHCDASVVIRTGLGEYNEFLGAGDEDKFVECLKNLKNSDSSVKNVFLASDNEEIREKVEKQLTSLGKTVFTIPDSIIHVSKVPSGSEEKILKTLAEFHIISSCDNHFLTQNSLFGQVASRLSSNQNNVFRISHRWCDDKKRIGKSSYVFCANPKYPDFCSSEPEVQAKIEL